MAPNPQCAALAAAKDKTGKSSRAASTRADSLPTGLSYAAIAEKIGDSEQRVVEICTGKARPTEAEFNKLAQALGIANVPHTGVHATVA
ncbi:hypothetical protein BDZ89DRAFT_86778 [Hymenopellis radicata]|nr:hypothetical protein BDZ89DRAFT_954032 [Hymenopellis radicata]KAF9025264.1 hypothetical protein BDZ89DRAFT_86778 [Hymenopellis radicata]